MAPPMQKLSAMQVVASQRAAFYRFPLIIAMTAWWKIGNGTDWSATDGRKLHRK